MKDKWISVEERLPEGEPSGKRYLVHTNTGNITLGYYYFNYDGNELDWQMESQTGNFKDWGYIITHWMPLPKPPK